MAVAELKATLLKLDKERQRIDDDLRSTKAQLDGLGVGMNEPLVDKEGFPRADVDLYQVRSLRQKVMMLLNDSKLKQKEVEESLAKLHALGPAALVPEKPSFATAASAGSSKSAPAAAVAGSGAASSSSAPSSVTPPEGMVFRPFALVDAVTEGSPAHSAKLLKGDRIAGIGSLVSIAPSESSSASSIPALPSLQDLAAVVRASVGVALPVVVQRGEAFIQLSLTPQPWSGQGLLGCHVLPLPAAASP